MPAIPSPMTPSPSIPALLRIGSHEIRWSYRQWSPCPDETFLKPDSCHPSVIRYSTALALPSLQAILLFIRTFTASVILLVQCIDPPTHQTGFYLVSNPHFVVVVDKSQSSYTLRRKNLSIPNFVPRTKIKGAILAPNTKKTHLKMKKLPIFGKTIT